MTLSRDRATRLHVAIACSACGREGSVAGVAMHHATELSKYFRVTLVSDSFSDSMPAEIDLIKVIPGGFNYLRRFSHVPNEYAFAKSTKKSIEAIHKVNHVDIIICHGHALAALSAEPLKKRYGIPYGLVTHGDIFDRPKGTYDWRLTAFYKSITPKAYRNADLVFALSPYMASCAIKGGASPDTVKIVPNGIDPADIGLDESVPRIVEKKQDDPLKLLFVGRLSIEKGVEVLIRACEILQERGARFTLDIVGAGPMEKTLIKLATGLGERINFHGLVARRSLGNLYQQTDLVCVPSLSEPLSLVVLESLISGTPVVGSNVGGIPFMIKTNHNGLLVPPGDPLALAEALWSLAGNHGKRESLAEHARSSVFPGFSWSTIGRQLVNLLAETVAAGEKQSPLIN